MTVIAYGKQNKNVALLLHGGGLSWWNYRDAAEILSEDIHVVLPVLDGHGGEKFTSIEDNAARIIQWEFPDFAVDAHLENLLKAQRILEDWGSIDGTIHRFMLVAQKGRDRDESHGIWQTE